MDDVQLAPRKGGNKPCARGFATYAGSYFVKLSGEAEDNLRGSAQYFLMRFECALRGGLTEPLCGLVS